VWVADDRESVQLNRKRSWRKAGVELKTAMTPIRPQQRKIEG